MCSLSYPCGKVWDGVIHITISKFKENTVCICLRQKTTAISGSVLPAAENAKKRSKPIRIGSIFGTRIIPCSAANSAANQTTKWKINPGCSYVTYHADLKLCICNGFFYGHCYPVLVPPLFRGYKYPVNQHGEVKVIAACHS